MGIIGIFANALAVANDHLAAVAPRAPSCAKAAAAAVRRAYIRLQRCRPKNGFGFVPRRRCGHYAARRLWLVTLSFSLCVVIRALPFAPLACARCG